MTRPTAGDAPHPPLDDVRLDKVHLVGVGGAGMSGIARVLLARGARVSGSDARESRVLAVLRALGADVRVGHDAANVGDAGVVVISSAIREDNVELVKARAAGLTVLPRGAALAALMAGRRGLVVAGTHGKTTTTSMLARALQHAGLDPTFAIGGDLNEPGSNAHEGHGPLFVAEADESDGSFLLLAPHAAVVTNIEADHLDHYRDTAGVVAAFEQFTDRIDPDGFLVTCADDAGGRALAGYARARGVAVRTYGESADVDLRVSRLALHVTGGASFDVVARDGTALASLRLTVPGRHNALNATAALAVGLGVGCAAEGLTRGLESFGGVRRRFELKGTVAGVRVYDDYAHHPTEVAATLLAARQVAPSGRIIVAFQPHRYSRTLAFASEFGAVLGAADEVVVMDVYDAGEDPLPGVSGASVAAEVPLPEGRVLFEPSWLAVPRLLAERARAGDVVLTLGAGDVTQLGPVVLEELARR